MRWPEEPDAVPARRDWRDTLRAAADIALLGLLTCIAALGVVTAAAAVATASAALHQWSQYDTWPAARSSARRFGRALLPGIPVSLLVLASAVILALNVGSLLAGTVPGGPVMVVITLLVAAALAGFAGLVTVEIGRTDGDGWRAAARRAAQLAQARPAVHLALSGVLVLGAALSVMVIPVAAPILVGYILFGLHAVVRRMHVYDPPVG